MSDHTFLNLNIIFRYVYKTYKSKIVVIAYKI